MGKKKKEELDQQRAHRDQQGSVQRRRGAIVE